MNFHSFDYHYMSNLKWWFFIVSFYIGLQQLYLDLTCVMTGKIMENYWCEWTFVPNKVIGHWATLAHPVWEFIRMNVSVRFSLVQRSPSLFIYMFGIRSAELKLAYELLFFCTCSFEPFWFQLFIDSTSFSGCRVWLEFQDFKNHFPVGLYSGVEKAMGCYACICFLCSFLEKSQVAPCHFWWEFSNEVWIYFSKLFC